MASRVRHDLYAVPALAGAAVVVAAHAAGTNNLAFPLIGFAVCFAGRMIGLRFNIQLPVAPTGTHSASPARPEDSLRPPRGGPPAGPR